MPDRKFNNAAAVDIAEAMSMASVAAARRAGIQPHDAEFLTARSIELATIVASHVIGGIVAIDKIDNIVDTVRDGARLLIAKQVPEYAALHPEMTDGYMARGGAAGVA